MFGDPVKNEKGWEKMKLIDVCTKITDGTHDTPERLTEGIKFINEIYRRCNPEFGDILYTNIGVNYATAAMNMVEYPFSMKNVALLKYNRKLLSSRFIEYLLNNDFFKDKLKRLTGIGGAQQFLSLAQIKSIEILVPDIQLQCIFEKRINKLRESLLINQKGIRISEHLFQSLLQNAFTGELIHD